MNRAPRVDARKFVPGGIRTEHGFQSGLDIKIPEYRAAGVRAFQLAKNLDDIIEELGLDYLNDLKRLRGEGDGYTDWSESPIDIESMKRGSPAEAAILISFQEACTDQRRKDSSMCLSLNSAKAGRGIFFALGNRRIILLDPKRRELQIAYAGPHTGERR
jgi:hypothetical protein